MEVARDAGGDEIVNTRLLPKCTVRNMQNSVETILAIESGTEVGQESNMQDIVFGRGGMLPTLDRPAPATRRDLCVEVPQEAVLDIPADIHLSSRIKRMSNVTGPPAIRH